MAPKLQRSRAMAARVADLMRADFIALQRDEGEYAADRLMRLARVRHLPVVEDGRLVGVLSHRDLREAVLARLELAVPPEHQRSLLSQPVQPLVRTDVVAVEPDCPLARAAELMLCYGIGFLPVVERDGSGDRLVGILTESDLLRAAYGSRFGIAPG